MCRGSFKDLTKKNYILPFKICMLFLHKLKTI